VAANARLVDAGAKVVCKSSGSAPSGFNPDRRRSLAKVKGLFDQVIADGRGVFARFGLDVAGRFWQVEVARVWIQHEIDFVNMLNEVPLDNDSFADVDIAAIANGWFHREPWQPAQTIERQCINKALEQISEDLRKALRSGCLSRGMILE